MEPTATYYTRRARHQRLQAAESVSPQARRAHLELALRYAKVATELPPGCRTIDDLAAAAADDSRGPAITGEQFGQVVAAVFSLPLSGLFADLLEAIDESEGRPTKRCARR